MLEWKYIKKTIFLNGPREKKAAKEKFCLRNLPKAPFLFSNLVSSNTFWQNTGSDSSLTAGCCLFLEEFFVKI